MVHCPASACLAEPSEALQASRSSAASPHGETARATSLREPSQPSSPSTQRTLRASVNAESCTGNENDSSTLRRSRRAFKRWKACRGGDAEDQRGEGEGEWQEACACGWGGTHRASGGHSKASSEPKSFGAHTPLVTAAAVADDTAATDMDKLGVAKAQRSSERCSGTPSNDASEGSTCSVKLRSGGLAA